MLKPLRPTGGLPTFEDQEADPKAIWNSVAGGRVQVSPLEEESVKRMLGEHYDERTRRERAESDEQMDTLARGGGALGMNALQGQILGGIERGRTDAASGPNGWARSWVPFFESLRGSKVKMTGPGGLVTTGVTGRDAAQSDDVERPAPPRPNRAMASLQGTDDPTDAHLDELWGQSSRKDSPAPSTWRTGSAAPPPRATPLSSQSTYTPTKDYYAALGNYASLGSLMRGK